MGMSESGGCLDSQNPNSLFTKLDLILGNLGLRLEHFWNLEFELRLVNMSDKNSHNIIMLHKAKYCKVNLFWLDLHKIFIIPGSVH